MSSVKILAHSLTSKERSKDVILTENISFSSLILPPEILKGLTDSGYEKPSPIQVKALPMGRCGFDLIVKSKSGTGKTLVFAIISLESTKINRCEPQVLILAPTREIAVQIQDVISHIGKYYKGLSVQSFIGGLPVNVDQDKCKTCHIVVGTPGRIKQLIQVGSLVVNSVKTFVLDEADKLSENSFQNDINEIYNSLPDRKQVLMFSATYPNEMQNFLCQYMHSPVLVTVELESPMLLGLRQYVRLLKFPPNVVQQTKVKNDELLKIISTVPFVQCLIFSNYQNRAESISNFLNRSGWSSIFMSAAQSQMKRLTSLSDLKDFKCKILVTTDLSARGIDAPNVDLIINYDIPFDATTYLHRIGRAGRYGSTGNCINLAFIGHEAKLLQNILGFIGGQNISIPVLDDSVNLDKIPKENSLFGDVDNFVTDFNSYRNKISEIRSTVTQHTKKVVKRSEARKPKSPNSNEADKLNSVINNELSGDVSSVLAQLASGCFELRTDETKVDTKARLFDELLGNAIDKSVPKDKHQAEAQNKLNFKPNILLRELADKGDVADVAPDVVSLRKDQTFCKNKALFSVAKMLSNVEVSSEDCSDLSAYVSSLKADDIEYLDEKSTESQLPEYPEVLENILSLAYKSQVSKGAKKWQDLLPEKEKAKLSEDFTAESDDVSQCEETPLFSDEEYYDEDYDFDIEKDIEVKFTDNSNDYSFMEWVPVEPQNSKLKAPKVKDLASGKSVLSRKQKSHKNITGNESEKHLALNSVLPRRQRAQDTLPYADHTTSTSGSDKYFFEYSQYFQHCSSNLWQNGLTFESVEKFDHWFVNDWEGQLNAVRDFVQQKIYLEEMSRY